MEVAQSVLRRLNHQQNFSICFDSPTLIEMYYSTVGAHSLGNRASPWWSVTIDLLPSSVPLVYQCQVNRRPHVWSAATACARALLNVGAPKGNGSNPLTSTNQYAEIMFDNLGFQQPDICPTHAAQPALARHFTHYRHSTFHLLYFTATLAVVGRTASATPVGFPHIRDSQCGENSEIGPEKE